MRIPLSTHNLFAVKKKRMLIGKRLHAVHEDFSINFHSFMNKLQKMKTSVAYLLFQKPFFSPWEFIFALLVMTAK